MPTEPRLAGGARHFHIEQREMRLGPRQFLKAAAHPDYPPTLVVGKPKILVNDHVLCNALAREACPGFRAESFSRLPQSYTPSCIAAAKSPRAGRYRPMT
jgi:hypothetical protein